MRARRVVDGVDWVGAMDWDRRVFDALVPIPDGTSYNAWLVRGRTGTALVDTVEPHFRDVLFARLADLGVERLDWVVANHAEQDHSGCLPDVLARFPGAQVLATRKGVDMLRDLLPLPEGAARAVEDGESIDLGGRTLRFLHTPWVHWPETMSTFCPEDGILFPCDLFGSHLAGEIAPADSAAALGAARLYYAQIMMPYRKFARKHLARLRALSPRWICPSHGPAWRDPSVILDAYEAWTSETPRNQVALPFVSMHESTRRMVEHLEEALADRGVGVLRLDLETLDAGRLATSLVDAATVVVGTPTVLGGAHPHAMHAAFLASVLKPKARWAAVIGSYGWGSRAPQQIGAALAEFGVELLEPVQARGRPDAATFAALDRLADAIASRHAALG